MYIKVGILCFICILCLLATPVSCENSNIKIDVYYNDELYPGASTPKPLLKIGEPFVLRFEVTCYKKNFLAVQLLSIGNDDFDIINGPTLSLGTGTRGVIEANETRIFEWTVAPNEEWAGGSAPIDFYYQMTDLDTPTTIAKGEFTAAYVTISEEYYDGAESTTDSTSNSEAESSSPSTPAFTALCAGFALVAAGIFKRK
nr:sarcinarray family MAST domain-containing protein [uncultured Methanolobus sp.]